MWNTDRTYRPGRTGKPSFNQDKDVTAEVTGSISVIDMKSTLEFDSHK
jgi:hypothetical protein